MFITKTMNESADIDIQQFDLVDSICESYEDLLNFNEALARFDIKEQELILIESAELDAFREDAMEKAKNMINDFISKLKVKWTKFLAYVNTQIIKFCDKNINSFVKQNKSVLGDFQKVFKAGDNAKVGSNNAINRYLSTYVVKGNTVVSLKDFVSKMKELLISFLTDEIDSPSIARDAMKKNMERDIVREFKDKIKQDIGEFTNKADAKIVSFPVDSIKGFNDAAKTLKDSSKADGIFNKLLNSAKTMIEKSSAEGLGDYHRYFNWVYVNSVKVYNIYLSMCRKYFVSLVASVHKMIKVYIKEEN
jgi:hypothetical protein